MSARRGAVNGMFTRKAAAGLILVRGMGAPESEMIDVTNRRRWWIVGLLFTASLINYFDRAALSFSLPLISDHFHLTPTQKGALSSAFFWSYALMQIPIGLCADRVNLRWLYAGAFALWSFSQGLTGMATSLGMLVVFRVMLGVGEAIYLPGGTKMYTERSPHVQGITGREEGAIRGINFDFWEDDGTTEWTEAYEHVKREAAAKGRKVE